MRLEATLLRGDETRQREDPCEGKSWNHCNPAAACAEELPAVLLRRDVPHSISQPEPDLPLYTGFDDEPIYLKMAVQGGHTLRCSSQTPAPSRYLTSQVSSFDRGLVFVLTFAPARSNVGAIRRTEGAACSQFSHPRGFLFADFPNRRDTFVLTPSTDAYMHSSERSECPVRDDGTL